MTIKQKKFVKNYIENGGNATKAALDTYNVSNYNTAHAIASENLQKPTIKQEIEEAMEAEGLSNEYVSEILKSATLSGLGNKSTNSDALRGIEMMLRLKGAFPDKIQRSAHVRIDYKQELRSKSDDELMRELKRLQGEVKELLANANS